MTTLDDLYDVRNSFYIGDYSNVINEGNILKLNDSKLQDELQQFVFRSHLALEKNPLPFHSNNEIEANAMKLFADYFIKGEKNNLESLDQQCDQSNFITLLLSSIYIKEGNFEKAFKLLSESKDAECKCILIGLLSKMNRFDLADKLLSEVKGLTNESVLCQMTEGWYILQKGGEETINAYYIFHELCQINQPTCLLLLGKALACMHTNRLVEAENLLLDALKKKSKNYAVLANLHICSLLLGKTDDKYKLDLMQSNPADPYLKDIELKNEIFDSAANEFSFEKFIK